MDFIDIVFEKRNKEYGAYYNRKKYARTLMVSFSITVFLILVFVVWAVAYKFYDEELLDMPKGVIFEPTLISEMETPPDLPETKPEELVVPISENLNETPQIEDTVRAVVKETPPPKDEPKDEAKDSTSGGASIGFENGDLKLSVQKLAEFPGGEEALHQFLQKNVRIPATLKNKVVHGTILVSFWVLREGKLFDIKIVRSLNAELDKECLRVVNKMPLWMPAISNGRPFPTQCTLPITF